MLKKISFPFASSLGFPLQLTRKAKIGAFELLKLLSVPGFKVPKDKRPQTDVQHNYHTKLGFVIQVVGLSMSVKHELSFV